MATLKNDIIQIYKHVPVTDNKNNIWEPPCVIGFATTVDNTIFLI